MNREVLNLICDFCSAPDPQREYKCANFESPEPLKGLAASQGSWLACDDCAELIDGEKWEELGNRQWESFARDNPDSAEYKYLLQPFQRKLLDKFKANRIP
jgi:hypothetical protein